MVAIREGAPVKIEEVQTKDGQTNGHTNGHSTVSTEDGQIGAIRVISLEETANLFSNPDGTPTRKKFGMHPVNSDRTIALRIAAQILKNKDKPPSLRKIADENKTILYRVVDIYNRMALVFGLKSVEIQRPSKSPWREAPKTRNRTSPKTNQAAEAIQKFVDINKGKEISLAEISRSLKEKGISLGTVRIAYHRFKEQRNWPKVQMGWYTSKIKRAVDKPATPNGQTAKDHSPVPIDIHLSELDNSLKPFPPHYAVIKYLHVVKRLSLRACARAVGMNYGGTQKAMQQMSKELTRPIYIPDGYTVTDLLVQYGNTLSKTKFKIPYAKNERRTNTDEKPISAEISTVYKSPKRDMAVQAIQNYVDTHPGRPLDLPSIIASLATEDISGETVYRAYRKLKTKKGWPDTKSKTREVVAAKALTVENLIKLFSKSDGTSIQIGVGHPSKVSDRYIAFCLFLVRLKSKAGVRQEDFPKIANGIKVLPHRVKRVLNHIEKTWPDFAIPQTPQINVALKARIAHHRNKHRLTRDQILKLENGLSKSKYHAIIRELKAEEKLTKKSQRRRIVEAIYRELKHNPKSRPSFSKVALDTKVNYKKVSSIYQMLSETLLLPQERIPQTVINPDALTSRMPASYGVVRHLTDKHGFTPAEILKMTGLDSQTISLALMVSERNPERGYEAPPHKASKSVIKYGLVYKAPTSKTEENKKAKAAASAAPAESQLDSYMESILAVTPKGRIYEVPTEAQYLARLRRETNPVRSSNPIDYFPVPLLGNTEHKTLAKDLGDDIARKISHLSRLWYKHIDSQTPEGSTINNQIDIVLTMIVTRLRLENGPFKKLASLLGVEPRDVPINFEALESAIQYCIKYADVEAKHTSETKYEEEAETTAELLDERLREEASSGFLQEEGLIDHPLPNC